MNSTFYADGYRDGQQSAPFSPPDAPALAIEYRKGYDAGRNAELFEQPTRDRESYEAALTRDRLTAALASPMTAPQRKLQKQVRPASLWQDPEQVGLFGGGQ